MNNSFKTTPHRVTHQISSGPSVKSVPSTSARTASASKPAPLQNLAGGSRRCASCGGGGRKF